MMVTIMGRRPIIRETLVIGPAALLRIKLTLYGPQAHITNTFSSLRSELNKTTHYGPQAHNKRLRSSRY